MPAKKHTLLVIDDEPDVCDSIHDLLRREFHVLKAQNAEEGESLLEEHEVHIIMTDQRMPRVTGVEFLKKMREAHCKAVRMLFTGYADLEAIIEAINQGRIFRFLRKPWQPEELLEAVRSAAAEYDRIYAEEEERRLLMEELARLRERVATLEAEVTSLKQAAR